MFRVETGFPGVESARWEHRQGLPPFLSRCCPRNTEQSSLIFGTQQYLVLPQYYDPKRPKPRTQGSSF